MDAPSLPEASKRREAVDCFNCSASRRPCDRTRHRCETCSRCSELCGGYPREWQWLAGVKSRGKHKGRSMSIPTSSRDWHSTTPVNHMFVFKPGNPKRKRAKGAGDSSTKPRRHRAGTDKMALPDAANFAATPSSNEQHFDQAEGESPTSVADPNHELLLAPDAEAAGGDSASLELTNAIFDDIDVSAIQDLDIDGNMLIPPLELESIWPDQTGSLQPSMIYLPPPPALSTPASLQAWETVELLTLCMNGHPTFTIRSMLTFTDLKMMRNFVSSP